MNRTLLIVWSLCLVTSVRAQSVARTYFRDARGEKQVPGEKKANFTRLEKEDTNGLQSVEFMRISDRETVSRKEYFKRQPVGLWLICDDEGNKVAEVDYDKLMCRDVRETTKKKDLNETTANLPAPDSAEKESPIFTIVEKMPEFPGGQVEMYNYLARNVKYPEYTRKMNIEGTVYLQFVILESGQVDSICILRSASPLLDREAVRAIQNMPEWTPGEQRGKRVKVNYVLPVKFHLN